MGPSEEQLKAIKHVDGPMMVLAGPGTGKTTVITYRVKYLIEECGVLPSEILVVTFSKAAAVEMQERFEALVGGGRQKVYFSTFHSLFFNILSTAYGYRPSNILSSRLKYRFLEEALMETKYEDIEDKREFLEEVEREISLIKGEGIKIDNYYSNICPEDVFRQLYRGLESRMRKNRYIDFDDMVLYTYDLFKKREDILRVWQNRFKYILVDEFQDINRLQYENVLMLAKPRNNLFIVGDDDQSIYGFRGARPDIMLSFPKTFKNLKEVNIGKNYRCSQPVLSSAVKLIGHNQKRYKKNILCAGKNKGNVHIMEYPDIRTQCDKVVAQIRKYMEDGIDPDNIAILFRTSRQMVPFSQRFYDLNIPFIMKEQTRSIYENMVAADIMAYLKMATGDRDAALFLKICNKPKRYISRKAVVSSEVNFGALYEYYRDKAYMCERINELQNDLFAMKSMTPYAAIDYIYNVVDYRNFMLEYALEKEISADDLEENFQVLREDAAGYKTIGEWFEHVEKMQEEIRKSKDVKVEHGVTLMTMHSSKGLEFDYVFIPDVNEDVIPYKKSKKEGKTEEERRLMYVAMTRAKKVLNISYTLSRYKRDAEASAFLAELS